MLYNKKKKLKDWKSSGDWAEVYQIQFNSPFYVQKIEHTSVRFDLTAIVFFFFKRHWCFSCLQAKYESTVLQFPPKTKQSEVAFTKKNA